MSDAAAQFWNRRYSAHSACWGEDGSPTLQAALRHFPASGRVLEIGYGYGRDLLLLARRGLEVVGIDPAGEGRRMAEERLAVRRLAATLMTADFVEADLPVAAFDAVLSHRTLHLMTGPGMAERFVRKLAAVARPGAIACIGTRDLRDLDPGRYRAKQDLLRSERALLPAPPKPAPRTSDIAAVSDDAPTLLSAEFEEARRQIGLAPSAARLPAQVPPTPLLFGQTLQSDFSPVLFEQIHSASAPPVTPVVRVANRSRTLLWVVIIVGLLLIIGGAAVVVALPAG